MNNLTRQIGLGVAACLLALSFPVYILFWIYPHFNDIITFEKEVNAKQIANHISKMMVFDISSKTLTPQSITENFIDTLKEAQQDFDLTKIKVFSSSGEVLYSTDAEDIGTFNANAYFNEVVSKGKIFSMVVRKNEKTMEDEIVEKDVVETYVPLMRDSYFIGAFEIYYDITYSAHSIGAFVLKSRTIFLVLSLSLLAIILLISVSSFMYLKKLRETEKKLQTFKDKMPPLYRMSLDETDD